MKNLCLVGGASQDLSRLVSLSRRETTHFLLIHAQFLAKELLAKVTGLFQRLQRLCTVSVVTGRGRTRHGRSATRLTTGQRSLVFHKSVLGSKDTLHTKLEEIHGQEPDKVPDPNNTSPIPTTATHISEAPVGIDGNEGSNQLSNNESGHQVNRWTFHEEPAAGTSDENQTLRHNRNLQVDDRVVNMIIDPIIGTGTRVFSTGQFNTKLIMEESGVEHDSSESQSGSGLIKTVDDSISENFAQVPLIRIRRRLDTISRNGHNSTIVQDSNDKDRERREIVLESKAKNGETDNNTNGDGTSIDSIVTHTLENLTGTNNSFDNDGKAGFSQDDISSGTGSIRSISDGNTNVSLGKSRSIVDTITSHSSHMTHGLKTFDNFIFMFGVDTSKTIGLQDHIVDAGITRASGRAILQGLGQEHVITHTKTTTCFLTNGQLITGNHLDLNTQSNGTVNGFLCIGTWGIVNGQKTDKTHTLAFTIDFTRGNFIDSHGQSTKTTTSKFIDIIVQSLNLSFGLITRAKIQDGMGHTLGNTQDGTIFKTLVSDFIRQAKADN
ncbi:hypothetical protein BDA99DRAFT_177685 [Phascolomyces articulosus]|uniref:Uncharacterized protein n=1 Tax=Phascolomyces articulosus TaxID=60185 RepID=A0AAD5P9Y6_9FUNG|nr:hypothetical protein BDA99DRAFT_177685 [Phascolomyces articulosus]